MRTLTALIATSYLFVSTVGASFAAAAQFLVRAGDDWSTLKEKVRPGDEIILMPGKHRAARFEDLHGESGKPIVIRSPDEKSMATIFSADIGIQLLRAKHVRIQNVAISGGKRAAIVVSGDGDGRSEHISLVNVYVAKTGDEGEQCGIRLERTDHATLKDCRVEAWHRAGVQVRGCTDVALNGVQFVASPGTADEYGVVIDGGSSSVILQRCRFGSGIGTAVALGPTGTGAIPSPPSPDPNAPLLEKPVLADGVTVERCLAKRVGKFVAFGSCSGVLVRANTVIDSGYAYALSEPPAGYGHVRNSTFLANLMTWTPGVMKSFCLVGAGAEPKGLILEANLWHSVELPLAKQILGDFAGTVKADQILDIDPQLDGYDRPRSEAAQNYGWTSA
jgi:hypothetical protein